MDRKNENTKIENDYLNFNTNTTIKNQLIKNGNT